VFQQHQQDILKNDFMPSFILLLCSLNKTADSPMSEKGEKCL
jgi:hypothetical protein